jgi:cytochrome P450
MEKTPALDQVFRETLRLHPPVSNLFRRTVRECNIDGVRIPAHTMISAPIHYIQQMEEHWIRAQTFWPERFSDGIAEHKKHPFMWAPFGGGAHKCIGMHFSQMEYKCFLHQFMLKFDFERTDQKDPWMQTLPLPKPSDDMPIRLKPRR